MDNVELGKKIRSLRKSRGMTQQMLSDYLGITRGQISNLELGRRGLDLPKLQKLCSLMNVNLDFFGIEHNAQETIDLLDRARLIFENDDIPTKEKDDLYIQLMDLYLKAKKE